MNTGLSSGVSGRPAEILLDEDDRARACQNYASAYIRKPVDLSGFVEVVDSVENFWFSVVILPPTN